MQYDIDKLLAPHPLLTSALALVGRGWGAAVGKEERVLAGGPVGMENITTLNTSAVASTSASAASDAPAGKLPKRSPEPRPVTHVLARNANHLSLQVTRGPRSKKSGRQPLLMILLTSTWRGQTCLRRRWPCQRRTTGTLSRPLRARRASAPTVRRRRLGSRPCSAVVGSSHTHAQSV